LRLSARFGPLTAISIGVGELIEPSGPATGQQPAERSPLKAPPRAVGLSASPGEFRQKCRGANLR
jgi:hypothetical protein